LNNFRFSQSDFRLKNFSIVKLNFWNGEKNMNLPLNGIKVIELSNYVAAPSASRLLVDLDAEVIKIEAHGGS